MTSSGGVITDITTFVFAQHIFDNNSKPVNYNDFKNLDFIIQLLLFNEKIWIIKPTYFGKNIDVEFPEILTKLINMGIIEIYSPKYYIDTENFLKSQYQEMMEIDKVKSYLSKDYLKDHPDIQKDLETYDKWTKLSNNAEAKDLADSIHLSKDSIPMFVNLMRTFMYLKTIDEMKSDFGKNMVISYAPHFLRASLIAQICTDYRLFRETVIVNTLNKMESNEKIERETLSKEYGANVELDLPILTTAVLKKCGDGKKSELIDNVLDLRNDKNVKKIRDNFVKFQTAVNEGDIKEIRKYDSKLKKVVQLLDNYPSAKAQLCTVPIINSSFIGGVAAIGTGAVKILSSDVTGAIDTAGGLLKIKTALDQYRVKRGDLAFFFNILDTLNDVNRSSAEFERVFNTKILNHS